jgi:toxin CcdB
MAQFDIYQYSKQKNSINLLMDIQSDFLSDLETRVVIPIYQYQPGQKLVGVLNPAVKLDLGDFYFSVPEMAAIHRRELGEYFGSYSHLRDEIISALDMLFTGI